MRTATLYKVLAALMALMGVAAGGELLIPTIVLLVSLPTMLVAFARYSRDGSFAVLGAHKRFVALMATGSVLGALLGGLLLGAIPALAAVLLISAVKMARHTAPDH